MRNTKRIILVGKGASGKDYLAEDLVKSGLKKDLSVTTRPPREGEIHGETYHYISKRGFEEISSIKDYLYESVEFNGWHYGTTGFGWKHSDVFIMTPSGVSKIKPEDRDDCLIVYLDIPEDVRRERMSKRSDADSVERRLAADEKDFENFTDFDIKITDQTEPIERTTVAIKSQTNFMFIEQGSNLFIVVFALSFLITLPFIYESHIKGHFPLHLVVFTVPFIMIGAIIYRWIKYRK